MQPFPVRKLWGANWQEVLMLVGDWPDEVLTDPAAAPPSHVTLLEGDQIRVSLANGEALYQGEQAGPYWRLRKLKSFRDYTMDPAP